MIMIKMKMMTFRLSDTVSEAGDRLSARHSHRGDDHDENVLTLMMVLTVVMLTMMV